MNAKNASFIDFKINTPFQDKVFFACMNAKNASFIDFKINKLIFE